MRQDIIQHFPPLPAVSTVQSATAEQCVCLSRMAVFVSPWGDPHHRGTGCSVAGRAPCPCETLALVVRPQDSPQDGTRDVAMRTPRRMRVPRKCALTYPLVTDALTWDLWATWPAEGTLPQTDSRPAMRAQGSRQNGIKGTHVECVAVWVCGASVARAVRLGHDTDSKAGLQGLSG